MAHNALTITEAKAILGLDNFNTVYEQFRNNVVRLMETNGVVLRQQVGTHA